jgi:hypothetical protein
MIFKIVSRLFIIIYLNLKEFEHVIVRDHLWDLFDQIKIRLSNYLSG